MIIPVVLSGGSGTRLWPLSRELYPKQLLPLASEATMLQDTVLRFSDVEAVGDPVIVCNNAHRFLVAEQLRKIDVSPRAILLEPAGRNTAPAVAAAAFAILADDDDSTDLRDAVMLVLPADHVIADVEAFRAAVTAGAAQARAGNLVTFGIVPESPHTGYGYIRKGAAAGDGGFSVDEFVEKPDAATAQTYLDSGDYYWNSGMFMFRVSRYLDELGRHEPAIVEATRAAVSEAREDLDFVRLGEESFANSPNISIDYAVMEKTDKAVVVPLDAGWNDVGTWSSLHHASARDDDNNVKIGDILVEDTHNCYLHASSRMIATVGLDNHVVIETADAVLVAPMGRDQDVKKLVDKLRTEDRGEAALHREVFRPWGSYDSIDMGPRYQVKRLSVKPGATLSLQMHHHRAEHWIVVKGTAKITRGDEEFLLTENQSTYIPLGTMHRISNPGTVPLDIIEVQSGSYLGEDDIVRFEDTYGRAGTNH